MTFMIYVSCLEEMVKLLRRVRTLRDTNYYNLRAFNGVHFRAYAIVFHLFGVSLLILVFISFATNELLIWKKRR